MAKWCRLWVSSLIYVWLLSLICGKQFQTILDRVIARSIYIWEQIRGPFSKSHVYSIFQGSCIRFAPAPCNVLLWLGIDRFNPWSSWFLHRAGPVVIIGVIIGLLPGHWNSTDEYGQIITCIPSSSWSNKRELQNHVYILYDTLYAFN